jgi:methyl-accepting chemotaxis protein
VPTWEEWQKGNEEFLRLSRQLDALNIGDPVQLQRLLTTFRGQHYLLQLNLLKCCNGAPLFEGGEDATACAFGKWKAGQKIENPEIAAMLREIDAFHHKFHAAAKTVKDKIKAGDVEGAKKIIIDEMEPEAKETFARFDQMDKTALAAIEFYDKLNHQAIDVCRPAQLKATYLLDKIAAINVQMGEAETKNSRAFSGTFKMICLVSVLV